MSGHCRFISKVVMVLGIIGTFWYAYTLYVAQLGGLVIMITLAAGGITTYVTYVIWAAMTEVLDQLEFLEGKMRYIEKKLTDTYQEQYKLEKQTNVINDL